MGVQTFRYGGGGGGGGYPDPEISGGGRFPKNWEKNFGRKISWGVGGGGRSPGSANALPAREQAG